jgi:transposase
MLAITTRNEVKYLFSQGNSQREIAKILKISVISVRKILREESRDEKSELTTSSELDDKKVALLKTLVVRCRGNLIRVHEILQEEYGEAIPYSTLTYLVRQHKLREKDEPKRAGIYHFQPGEEMHWDTSPHEVELSGKRLKAQCASLVLAYSRRIYVQYYPCFTRFEGKVFLSQAFAFMQGCCRRCVIDNTNIAIIRGAGCYAGIARDMAMFARAFNIEFFAHAVGHCNRKARVERPFHFVERNFLAGRTFKDWEDLNQQALDWCCNVSNRKPKRTLQERTPEEVYQEEKPYLLPLPAVFPPIYLYYKRIVDYQGFIHLDTNFYSVPERLINQTLDVYKYPSVVKIYSGEKIMAEHRRLIGVRYQPSLQEGHHTITQNAAQLFMTEAEAYLRGSCKILDAYLTEFKKHVRGRGIQQLARLRDLKLTYPNAAFTTAIQIAQQYGLYDLNRLEELIIQNVSTDYSLNNDGR